MNVSRTEAEEKKTRGAKRQPPTQRTRNKEKKTKGKPSGNQRSLTRHGAEAGEGGGGDDKDGRGAHGFWSLVRERGERRACGKARVGAFRGRAPTEAKRKKKDK